VAEGALLAVTLTTAGAALRAAADRGCAGLAPWASETGTELSGVPTTRGPKLPNAPPRCSHSGLKVPTTNSTATATVTAWEKMSQILRMTLNERMSDGNAGGG
jgi:hypothetical protein